MLHPLWKKNSHIKLYFRNKKNFSLSDKKIAPRANPFIHKVSLKKIKILKLLLYTV